MPHQEQDKKAPNGHHFFHRDADALPDITSQPKANEEKWGLVESRCIEIVNIHHGGKNQNCGYYRVGNFLQQSIP